MRRLPRADLPGRRSRSAGCAVHAAPLDGARLRRGRVISSPSRPSARGRQLGTEVFAAQPPAFYWLLRSIADDPRASTPEHIRLGIALLAACGTCGRMGSRSHRSPGRSPGVLAAASRDDLPSDPALGGSHPRGPPVCSWLALALGRPRRWRRPRSPGTSSSQRRRAPRRPGGRDEGLGGNHDPGSRRNPARRGGVRRGSFGPAGGLLPWRRVSSSPTRVRSGDLWKSVVTCPPAGRLDVPAVIDRWESIADLFNPTQDPAFWLVVVGAHRLRAAGALRRAYGGGDRAVGMGGRCFRLPRNVLARLHYNHLVALPVPLALRCGSPSLGPQAWRPRRGSSSGRSRWSWHSRWWSRQAYVHSNGDG